MLLINPLVSQKMTHLHYLLCLQPTIGPYIRTEHPSASKSLYWLLSCMRLFGSHPFCNQPLLQGKSQGKAGWQDLSRPSVPHSAHSRLSCKVRQAPQDVTKPGLKNSPKLEAAQLPCVLTPLLGCPRGRKAASYLRPEPLVFHFITTISHPLAVYCYEKPDSLMTSS